MIGIIGALEELGVASHAQAVTGVMTAASHGRVSATNAAGVLLGLAGTADEAGMALVGNAFGELIAGGLDPTDVNTILFRSLQSNLVEAVPASSVIAYAMGAITGLPNADDYLYAFGSILAQAAPEAAVGAVDRAYEAGAIDAHDVVGLLTWMHGVSGALTADTRCGHRARALEDARGWRRRARRDFHADRRHRYRIDILDAGGADRCDVGDAAGR